MSLLDWRGTAMWATGPVLVSTEDKVAKTASNGNVTFLGIEDIDLIDDDVLTETTFDDIYVRGTASADVIQTLVGATLAEPDRVRVRAGGFSECRHGVVAPPLIPQNPPAA